MCDYLLSNGNYCMEEIVERDNLGSGYCIDHCWYGGIAKCDCEAFPCEHNRECVERYDMKRRRIQEKIEKQDFDFEGFRFEDPKTYDSYNFWGNKPDLDVTVNLDEKEITGDVNFIGAEIGNVNMVKTKMDGRLLLDRSSIDRLYAPGIVIKTGNIDNEASLGHYILKDSYDGTEEEMKANIVLSSEGASIGYLNLNGGCIEGACCFKDFKANRLIADDARVQGEVIFVDAEIKSILSFDRANIDNGVILSNLTIGGVLNFNGAFLGQNKKKPTIDFYGIETTEKSRMAFHKTRFKDSGLQEIICRRAKRIYEDHGNREEADYHFYREMEGRRKQKEYFRRYPELFVQYIFGYGTFWRGIVALYLTVIISISLAFYCFHGVNNATTLWQCIYFSFVTATTLGFGDLLPVPRLWAQALVVFLAVFGTFIWAALIVTIARKYTR